MKIRELEGILEYEIKEKEKVIARIERITAERDTLAQELKTIAQDVVSQNYSYPCPDTVDSLFTID